jgi:predicted unusual protein kinase regulating ubiquinone biosynthesis (AarF/ABC1/UbiB family)
LPARLTADWENTKDQFEDLRRRLELETDYELEATNLRKARSLFCEEDRIVVPRVFPQFSTSRVLTMDRLQGVHLREFLSRDPMQRERNDVGRAMIKAWYRLLFAGRMLYVDMHPGNFLILTDGRLGVIDFGLIIPLQGEEWELYRKMDRPLTTGRREERLAVLKEWNDVRDDETDRLRLFDEYTEWCWRPRYCGGDFDFGNEADFRRGIELFTEMIRKRYNRSRPSTPSVARCQFGWVSLLYQLRARFDVRELAEEEVKATGWDRSDYAPRN